MEQWTFIERVATGIGIRWDTIRKWRARQHVPHAHRLIIVDAAQREGFPLDRRVFDNPPPPGRVGRPRKYSDSLIGLSLDAWMTLHKVSANELARAIGCSPVTINRIRNCRQCPRPALADRIETITKGEVPKERLFAPSASEKERAA